MILTSSLGTGRLTCRDSFIRSLGRKHGSTTTARLLCGKYGTDGRTWWSLKSMGRKDTSRHYPYVYTVLRPNSGHLILPTAATARSPNPRPESSRTDAVNFLTRKR